MNTNLPKLKIGWFYPKYLNLYGDRGNVEILVARAKLRNIPVEVIEIDLDTKLDAAFFKEINLVFMGGGPDLDQQKIYLDFLENKGNHLMEFLNNFGVGLFICGSYQLLGKYYKDAYEKILEGLGFLDFYTESPSSSEKTKSKSRMIGNIIVEVNSLLLNEPVFRSHNKLGNTFVGFENHGGRTYLSKDLIPLGLTQKNQGNNDLDFTEGVFYKNTFGTYLHGPLLARNPHFADYLIAKSIKIESLPHSAELEKFDTSVIVSAHEKSKKLKR
ncbi:MAG TPA: hypothetical protein PLT50_03465 [bacterium]|nr:hypothetical protein [bacterium]